MRVQWIDRKREPRSPPDPAYPEGIDIPAADGSRPKCQTDLPYPAARCGVYLVTCSRCGVRVAVTTAGRPDDPRTVAVNCLLPGGG